MLDSRPLLFPTDFPAPRRACLETLQVNLGYRCNQQCQHCHVDAGPKRSEVMTRETIDEVLVFLRASGVTSLDLTGGAPEMNPGFRYLVEQARAIGVSVLDRCNLTILEEPGQEDLAGFLAAHRVEVVASLPCYEPENVDAQRGRGVFEKSIRALRRLNALGYGSGGALRLDLVYNPVGPWLPPAQCELERDYKRRLDEGWGVRFDHLLTLANLPIQRFGSMLQSQRRFDEYLDLLKSSHRQANLDAVMCRSLISVDWRGFLYDCDFNQMLDLPLRADGRRLRLRDLDATALEGRPVRVGEHCWGCTAGQGSSCGGALAEH